MNQTRHLTRHESRLSRKERYNHLGQPGATLWFVGLSASGKSTLSSALETQLVQMGLHCYRLDGDNMRQGLNQDLGFSREDRGENIRRLCEVACLLSDSGCIALVAAISPYEADRARCRARHESQGLPFLELFVDAPLAVCEERDPKGLYRKARGGLITQFTGIDDPFETPSSPDLVLRTAKEPVETCLEKIVELLRLRGVVPEDSRRPQG